MNVNSWGIAQEAVNGGHVQVFAPSFHGRAAENHLCDVLFTHEIGRGSCDTLALQANDP